MKALIFAAGLGTRLKPLTETMPKALVPAGEKPLLEHVILRLKNSGVTDVIVNIHHFGDQIIEFIKANDSFGINIEFSDESDLLRDTGGGIKKTARFFNDGAPFLVHNVDIISDVDLNKMYKSHLNSKALVSLFVSNRKTNRYLLFDTNNRLRGWFNNQTEEIRPGEVMLRVSNYQQLAFNGIHIISPEIFPLMADWGEKFSIIDFYLSIVSTENIQAFTQPDAFIIDVGKMDSLEKVRELITNKITR